MATVKNKQKGFGDIKGNIPNVDFWIALTKYTMVGCAVSYKFAKSKIGKDENSHRKIDDDATNAHGEF